MYFNSVKRLSNRMLIFHPVTGQHQTLTVGRSAHFLYFLFEVMANFSDYFFQWALQTDEMSTNWR